MKTIHHTFKGLHTFVLLWATQAFSALGSSMTSYALVIWAYQQTGSALSTSLLRHLFLCTLCAVKYFCRRFKRPLEQEVYHAGL